MIASTGFPRPTLIIIALFSELIWRIQAETHVVHFDNKCGFGDPKLIQGDRILSTGGDFISNGPLKSAIAYLQNGTCGLNGEGCTMVETTLVNAACAGCGSSTDITLIPPHEFSVPVGFYYYNGCNGAGATCSGRECTTAFRQPTDNSVQVSCQTDNVNLAIKFC